MVSRCINPHCAVHWNLFGASAFGAGALYAFEKSKTDHPPHRKEYIWLCASCATRLTLETDAAGVVVVTPHSRARAASRSDGPSDLRLVFRSTWVLLPADTGFWTQGAQINKRL
jgi:hypothetical protein